MGVGVRDLAPRVVLGRVPAERGHPDSRSPDRSESQSRRRAAGWLAVGYLLFFGVVGIHLLGNPYLVTLDGGQRPLCDRAGRVAAVALARGDRSPGRPLPSRRAPADSDRTAAALRRVSRHRRLGVAAARRRDGAAIRHFGWLGRPDGHRRRGRWRSTSRRPSPCLSSPAWRRRSRPHGGGPSSGNTPSPWRSIAVAITEFVRRFVLPSLAFGDVDAAVGAIPFGVVMALMWSGWRVRQRRRDRPADTALAMLVGAVRRPLDPIAAARRRRAGGGGHRISTRRAGGLGADHESADRADRSRADLRLLSGPVPRPAGRLVVEPPARGRSARRAAGARGAALRQHALSSRRPATPASSRNWRSSGCRRPTRSAPPSRGSGSNNSRRTWTTTMR